jgi:riboflavin kinase / FMN adenylyltransferase
MTGSRAIDGAMTALHDLDDRSRVVTIGTFDGVHLGHQQLLTRTVARANELGTSSLALTFEPPPAMVLRPDRFPGRICSAEAKLLRLNATGIGEVAIVPFDRTLSQQTPEAFMSQIAMATHLTELWVGEAFALGKDRVGNVERLTEIGDNLGFKVVAMPRVTVDDAVVSSSAIRQAILNGDAARARTLLGRPFLISGEVIHGAHLGRTIGFPTANVVPPSWLVPLADGIYASMTRLPNGGGRWPAMTYIGTRPTVNSGERQIETNIFDFVGDLYGQTIDVEIHARLRGDAVFAGLEELVAQLHRDEVDARTILELEIGREARPSD